MPTLACRSHVERALKSVWYKGDPAPVKRKRREETKGPEKEERS